jgi:acetolactate synthase regulatory subunit
MEKYMNSGKATVREIELNVINSQTILVRVIQIITRRRIAILKFIASVTKEDDQDGKIIICVRANERNLILLKTQFEKVVDVIKVIG